MTHLSANIGRAREMAARLARAARDRHMYRVIPDPVTCPILDVESVAASIATVHRPLPWDDRRPPAIMASGCSRPFTRRSRLWRFVERGAESGPGSRKDISHRIMNRKRLSFPLWLAFLMIAMPAIAQEDRVPPGMSTDRPGQAMSPTILSPGYVQLESGFQMSTDKTRDESETITTRTLSAPGSLLRIGALNSMELRVGLEYRCVTASAGNTDRTTGGPASAIIGAKVGVAAEDRMIPEAGIALLFELPLGDR